MKNSPRRRSSGPKRSGSPSSPRSRKPADSEDKRASTGPRSPREYGEERLGNRGSSAPKRGPRRDDDRPKRNAWGDEDDRPKRSNWEDADRPSRAPRREDGDRPTRSYNRSSSDDRPSRAPRRDDDRPSRAPRRDDDRPTRSYSRDRDERPARREEGDRPARSYNRSGSDDRPSRAPRRDDDRPTRSYSRDRDERPARREDGDRPARSYNRSSSDERPSRAPRRDDDRPTRSYSRDRDERPARREEGDRPARSYNRSGSDDRPSRAPRRDDDRPSRAPRRDDDRGEYQSPKSRRSFGDQPDARPFASVKRGSKKNVNLPSQDGAIRLNRYISMAGICSRREADEMIEAGLFSVNGEVVTELGTKVLPGDDIRYNGERIKNEKLVYVLLNKPKDYITTMDDPDKRKTVMELVQGAGRERIYPVGRLDRNTTGLLLLTNDGDLAKTLTHPSSRVRKVYSVELDKPLKVSDMRKIIEGVEVEEIGMVQVDDIAFDKEGADKRNVGIEIHSGQNRVVRRLFEQLGYEVTKLDRTSFAGLTKKDLPRGRWRYLAEQEIGMLKMIVGGPKKAKPVAR